jgi:hypothetical protein
MFYSNALITFVAVAPSSFDPVSEMVYNNQQVFKMTCFGYLSVIYLNALEVL